MEHLLDTMSKMNLIDRISRKRAHIEIYSTLHKNITQLRIKHKIHSTGNSKQMLTKGWYTATTDNPDHTQNKDSPN